MKNAIKKALSGGWQPKGITFSIEAMSYKVQALDKVKYKERFLLDPLFWQALGKSLGWDEHFVGKHYSNINADDGSLVEVSKTGKHTCNEHCITRINHGVEWADQEWLYRWHSLVDHLANGGDADSFFEALIPNQK